MGLLVRFTVTPDVVVTPEQFVERLHSRSFDLILAEHPNRGGRETEVLEILEQVKRHPSYVLGVRLEARNGWGVHPEWCC